MYFTSPPCWRTYQRTPATAISRPWQHWLLERGSLTARLIKLSKGDFHVKVIAEYWAVPDITEANTLGLRHRQRAYIREVELWGNNQCWVKARTLIPRTSLRGFLLPLKHIGSKPLGAKLFADPKITRGAIEIAQLNGDSGPEWARRSVFKLNNQPLLVTEIFMSSLLAVE